MDWPVIHSYTRAEAISDGVLVDLSTWASKNGFRCPVAITREAWEQAIEVSPEAAAYGQTEQNRAGVVLRALLLAIRRPGASGSELEYQVKVQDGAGEPRTVDLKSVAGPGDQGELVITIMLPGQD